jgi:hypothetical protein
MVLRRGAGGYYVNGILARWPRSAFSIRDAETQTRIANGELVIRNISVLDLGTKPATAGPAFENGPVCPAENCRVSLDLGTNGITAEAGEVTTAATFTGVPAAPTTEPTVGTLDFSLAAGAAARTGGSGTFTGALATKAGVFVAGTDYRGAWDPLGTTGKWWLGWTSYAQR